MIDDESHDFDEFLKRREAAARAYVSGDAEPLDRLVTHRSPATFFGPMGGFEEGAKRVVAVYDRDAGHFQAGSETHFEILHQAASGDVGYWVGFQHAAARMKGRAEPIPMKLRVTEVYRREDGDWKLVHRHADSLAEPETRKS
jgi:ketosteroid isomerase-like protein